jgi:acyl-CoA reductase-like NAD-dependent aldehyde dehydrogenase
MSNIQTTISPVDGSVYVERELASPLQIEAVLQRAVEAQQAWKQTSLEERAAICERMVQYMLDHVDEIATEISWQMGRPIRYAAGEITRGFQERARYMISIAPEALKDIAASPKEGLKTLRPAPKKVFSVSSAANPLVWCSSLPPGTIPI